MTATYSPQGAPPQPPVTPPQPPSHGWRNLPVWGRGLIVAAVILLAFGTIGALSGHKSTPAAPKAAPAATAAPQWTPVTGTTAPVTTPPPSPAPAATPAAQTYAQWLAGPGGIDLQAVKADLTQTATDAQAGNVTAVETDGQSLQADATNAGSNPPPVDPADYQAAMQQWVTAGTDAAQGDFTDATTALQAGTADLQRVTAAVSAS